MLLVLGIRQILRVAQAPLLPLPHRCWNILSFLGELALTGLADGELCVADAKGAHPFCGLAVPLVDERLACCCCPTSELLGRGQSPMFLSAG